MTAPIPVLVRRHKCPHCPRTASRPVRVREHMNRCWYNPAARGCKTCKHFDQDPGDAEVGLVGGEFCGAGVDLTGRPACGTCNGVGETFDRGTLGVSECHECGGDGAEVKSGPIVHCDLWEASS
ncbi:hypothetical protein ACQP2Y_21890 [Actinoplanes sp. CA-051413]|uniref:hypothetical protein n=1 Tax=Actinoplanes sp. CA-051413 TaxID=3239899 RepID=UPI003D9720E6